jgi:predicted tellurium resistance membrane protein TerC
MDWITDPQAWIAFATLTVLEIVLGIDNIVFISILSSRLPKAQQPRARALGLALAMLSRIVLLFSLSWISRLTAPLFTVLSEEISGRDLVLIFGGLFFSPRAPTRSTPGWKANPAGESRGWPPPCEAC